MATIDGWVILAMLIDGKIDAKQAQHVNSARIKAIHSGWRRAA